MRTFPALRPLGAVLFLASFSSGCGKPDACTPGEQVACACADGDGFQVCEDDGASFGDCQCGDDDTDVGDTVVSDTEVSDTEVVDTVVDDTEVVPTCDETPIFAGVVAVGDVTTGYTGASNWSYMGDLGLEAGQGMCAAVHAGSHVCDYEELKAAEARADGIEDVFDAVAQGTTMWVHRTTTATVGGQPSAAGAGGRCNDWTYATNHLSDGEYVKFDAVGDPTFVLDNDTLFDPVSPGEHTLIDLQCGGVNRAIPCCVTCVD